MAQSFYPIGFVNFQAINSFFDDKPKPKHNAKTQFNIWGLTRVGG
jgi:hypothetical protein